MAGATARPSRGPFPRIRDHVLLKFASELARSRCHDDRAPHARVIAKSLRSFPTPGSRRDPPFATTQLARDAYIQYFTRRLESPREFFEEAIRAR